MNKPSSIIISSSAPSLPHYPPPPPHPYFCLFIHMTARAEEGRGAGAPGRMPRLHGVAALAREPRAAAAACALGAPRCLRACVHVRGRARCLSAHVQRVRVTGCVTTPVPVRQDGCEPVGVCLRCLCGSVCLGGSAQACDCGAGVSLLAAADGVCL